MTPKLSTQKFYFTNNFILTGYKALFAIFNNITCNLSYIKYNYTLNRWNQWNQSIMEPTSVSKISDQYETYTPLYDKYNKIINKFN